MLALEGKTFGEGAMITIQPAAFVEILFGAFAVGLYCGAFSIFARRRGRK